MAGCLLTSGTLVKCSFGATPGPLMGNPENGLILTPIVSAENTTPFVNIPSFGMCASLANPAVAAATAAAFGVLTPQPCVPNPTGTWVPDPTSPNTLSQTTMCPCAFGGMITPIVPAQTFAVEA